MNEYTHTGLDDSVEFIAGSYEIESENRMTYGDREILYLIGNTSQVCGCCGNSCDGLSFITVPGYIVSWKSRENEAGAPVTEVELITDDRTREEITKILQGKHYVTSVGFW